MKLFSSLKFTLLAIGLVLTFWDLPSSFAELTTSEPKKKTNSCKDRFSGEALRYHRPTQDGRCVWSCGAGTTPDFDSGECKCQVGKTESGKDKSKRRVCK